MNIEPIFTTAEIEAILANEIIEVNTEAESTPWFLDSYDDLDLELLYA